MHSILSVSDAWHLRTHRIAAQAHHTAYQHEVTYRVKLVPVFDCGLYCIFKQ